MDEEEELIETCKEIQKVELEVLISIYTEDLLIFRQSKSSSSSYNSSKFDEVEVSIQLDFGQNFDVECYSEAEQSKNIKSSLSLRFLPAFKFTARLPPTYPLKVPPIFEIDCDWAAESDLERARGALKRLSSVEGEECIANCIDWLEHDWFDPMKQPSIRPKILIKNEGSSLNSVIAKERLVEYDKNLSNEAFMNQIFDCGICLETQRGRKCFKLSKCGHFFCRECLMDYLKLMIKEGTIEQVKCCHPDCVESGQRVIDLPGRYERITESELEDLVGRDLKDRYSRLYDKKLVESDPRNCYCPIKTCGAAVIHEKVGGQKKDRRNINGEDEEQEEYGNLIFNLRSCKSCGFSFCNACRKTWHGKANECSQPIFEKLIEEFMTGTDESRRLTEIKYGKKNFKKLIDHSIEELVNRKWKDVNSTQCPNCSTPIEKSSGCNHMTCERCKTHFCYRCSRKFKADQVYLHYGETTSSCYGALFEDRKFKHEYEELDEDYDQEKIESLKLLRSQYFSS